MYEQFTDRARKAMHLANQEAQRFNHEYLGTEHLLLGLIKEGTGTAAAILRDCGVDLRQICSSIERLLAFAPEPSWRDELPQTPRVQNVIRYSLQAARELNTNFVGTEHLLLALLKDGEGIAAQVLHNLGLRFEEVHKKVVERYRADTSRDSTLCATPLNEATLSSSITEVCDRMMQIETDIIDLLAASIKQDVKDGPASAMTKSLARSLAAIHDACTALTTETH